MKNELENLKIYFCAYIPDPCGGYPISGVCETEFFSCFDGVPKFKITPVASEIYPEKNRVLFRDRNLTLTDTIGHILNTEQEIQGVRIAFAEAHAMARSILLTTISADIEEQKKHVARLEAVWHVVEDVPARLV